MDTLGRIRLRLTAIAQSRSLEQIEDELADVLTVLRGARALEWEQKREQRLGPWKRHALPRDFPSDRPGNNDRG